MKTLYIVRHAKSSWDYPGLEDYQRPLLEKGKKRTKYIVDYLQEKNAHVDLIMSSHATRALETAKIIAKALKYPENKIMISKNIYHSDPDGLFNLFFDLSDDIDSIMIVGHNPTFTYFANFFLERKLDNLPTSGVVCIDFKTDNWENIASSGRITKFVVSPKSLKSRNARN
jgi:phosphohistidine phosphatase